MEFRVINKSVEATTDDSGVLHITGIANTGLEDISGDTLTREALLNIVEQATNHNLHMDHDTSLDGVLGPITSAELTENGVEIHADIVNTTYKEKILELLEGGANFGLSVGGVSILDKQNKHDIDNISLTEISLTPIPCDQQTMGSVAIAKSFKEAFDICKNDVEIDVVEVEKMAEETITKTEAIELINEAFNERREEYLEEIRGELKTEYEVRINELEARIETLESQVQDTKVEDVIDEEAVVEEVTATKEEEEERDSVPVFTEEQIKEATKEEESEEEEVVEEEEEEEEEDIKKAISEILDEKLDKIFMNKNAKDLSFKYNEETQPAEEESVEVKKNIFTIREAAEQLANH